MHVLCSPVHSHVLGVGLSQALGEAVCSVSPHRPALLSSWERVESRQSWTPWLPTLQIFPFWPPLPSLEDLFLQDCLACVLGCNRNQVRIIKRGGRLWRQLEFPVIFANYDPSPAVSTPGIHLQFHLGTFVVSFEAYCCSIVLCSVPSGKDWVFGFLKPMSLGDSLCSSG